MSQSPAFYLVYIVRSPSSSLDDIKKVMNKSLDWFRVNERVWILFTTSDHDIWYSRLKPLIEDSGSLLVVKLDMNARQGWMTKNFWSWIKEKEKELEDEE